MASMTLYTLFRGGRDKLVSIFMSICSGRQASRVQWTADHSNASLTQVHLALSRVHLYLLTTPVVHLSWGHPREHRWLLVLNHYCT